MSYTIQVNGGRVTGKAEDEDIVAKIGFVVYSEKQTRHHPGGTYCEDIRIVNLDGADEEDEWEERFLDWAHDNKDELIEHAGDIEQDRRAEEAERRMERERERRRKVDNW